MDERLDLGASLLTLARCAIARELGIVPVRDVEPAEFPVIGATFVTLRLAGDLRGCIGSVSAWRPLGEDVRENAIAAAFRDPRFMPLSRLEFAGTSIEVSLLGAQEPVAAGAEEEALAALRPGVDGVIIEYGRLRATFLPQVWEQLPDPRSFMNALKRKAGLPERFWSEDIRLARYAVEKFAEDDMKAIS
jgi:AmmeMemoRadiSam system protein A